MVDDGDTGEDDAPAEADRTRPPDRPGLSDRLPTILVGAAAVVMIALIVGLVLQSVRASDLSGEQDAQRAAKKAAGEFAEAVYGYDHRDLEASLDDILNLVTDDYA